MNKKRKSLSQKAQALGYTALLSAVVSPACSPYKDAQALNEEQWDAIYEMRDYDEQYALPATLEMMNQADDDKVFGSNKKEGIDAYTDSLLAAEDKLQEIIENEDIYLTYDPTDLYAAKYDRAGDHDRIYINSAFTAIYKLDGTRVTEEAIIPVADLIDDDTLLHEAAHEEDYHSLKVSQAAKKNDLDIKTVIEKKDLPYFINYTYGQTEYRVRYFLEPYTILTDIQKRIDAGEITYAQGMQEFHDKFQINYDEPLFFNGEDFKDYFDARGIPEIGISPDEQFKSWGDGFFYELAIPVQDLFFHLADEAHDETGQEYIVADFNESYAAYLERNNLHEDIEVSTSGPREKKPIKLR
ncbi:MAG: hypothetical protein WC752_00115 [Patescibacteria group bacterium]|jgi:hypothetical protein